MTDSLSFYVAIWIVIAASVLFLALYRLAVDKGDYTVLHVRKSEVSLIPKQFVRAHRLEVVDQWGKLLTGIAVAYGLILGVGYFMLALK